MLYTLAVMTGMRQGELLGLQWADVDWTAGRVQVRHTLQWLKGGEWRPDEPKTGHTRRSIRLPATAVQQLKAHPNAKVKARANAVLEQTIDVDWAKIVAVFAKRSPVSDMRIVNTRWGLNPGSTARRAM
mgnify:CR=1 FL=1